MKKTVLLSVFVILNTFNLKAQVVEFDWAFSAGDLLSDGGLGLELDASGHILTTGLFGNIVDFDPGPGVFNLVSNGGYDIFIMKVDSSGNFIWAKSIGSTTGQIAYDLSTDANDNVYITGFFEDSIDFDPGPGVFNLTSNGFKDVFILKLDSSGNFIWAKNIGGNSNESGFSLDVDGNGNVYTAGYFRDTADFDPGPGTYYLTSAQINDGFVSKLDVNGNFVWAVNFNGDPSMICSSLALDGDDYVYATGWFSAAADFDPGPGIYNLPYAGSKDIYVSKLDSGGNFIWAKAIGGSSADESKSIVIDGLGNILVTGWFQDTADFDPGSGVYNLNSPATLNFDLFVTKWDSGGNFTWAKSLGGPTSEVGYGINVDAGGYVFITGSFGDSADFDPGPGVYTMVSAGHEDIFILGLNPSGDFLFAKRAGSTFQDPSVAIDVDINGGIYITGNFNFTVDFDPGPGQYNLTSAGAADFFILKLKPETTGSPELSTGKYLSVFPNPAESFISVSLEKNQIKNLLLYDLLGCPVPFTQTESDQTVKIFLHVAPGLYFLEAETRNGEKYRTMFIKQ